MPGDNIVAEQTILASDLRVITRFLAAHRADPGSALGAAGISLEHLNQPRNRIPAAQVGTLLVQLSEQFPDTNLGMELARHHHMTDTHVLGITAISSNSGLEALQRLIRYQALVSTLEPLSLAEDTDAVTLTKTVALDEIAEHIVQVFLFAVILGAIRNISGFTGDIIKVSFTGSAQGHEAAYREHFGPTVSFSAREANLVLPRGALEQPISTANVDILTANEPMLASLVRSVRENSLPAKIKVAILDHLPDHTLSEEEAAASQNMSLRTFQRRLEDEGTRFRALLDQTRTERAESLLADSSNTLSEVSYQCGFSEQASFSRAFKRWTGKTPSQYRSKLLDPTI